MTFIISKAQLRVSVIFIVTLTYLVTGISSCTCNLRHPQQHVCEADFVIAARVRKPTTTPDGLTSYKVRIKRLFKASEKVQVVLSKKVVYTIPGQCDVILEPKTTYLLAGDVEGAKPWLSACSFAQPWRSLAPKMKKGFKLLYQTGCDCPITSCHWWEKCPPGKFFCPWETSTDAEDCQGRHGVCLRSPDGSCKWLGGRLYRSCMRNRTLSMGGSANDIVSPSHSFRSGKNGANKRLKHKHAGFKLDKTLYEVHH